MKKTLLLCAAALFSLMASAGDGLVAVGANTILLPSSYWDGDIEWSAWTWVYNSGNSYGDWNTENPNYNLLCTLGPEEDANGIQWFEPGFDMGPKEGDINWDQFDEEGNELPILWEEHTAPYSTDATYKGRSSYQWTGNSIMADIYVRRIFTIDPSQLLAGPVYLACGHDDAPAEYYINGELVYERTGEETDDNGNIINGWNEAEYILLTDEQKALINLNGEENLIAFHVHQNWGGALADCGLYTKIEGGLDMGYTTPWEGKVLFNNYGGFAYRDAATDSPVESTSHPWSALYEAQEGDVYTFTMPGNSSLDDMDYDWREQLHFKTPIKIEEGHKYNFKVKLAADKPFSFVTVKLTDNDNDDIELAYDEVEIEEGEDTEVEFNDIDGQEINNFKIAFDFGGGEEGATVTIKDISLVDLTPEEEDLDEKELWVGTHYFNFFDMHKRSVKYLVWDDTIPDENGDLGDYREAKTDEEIAEAIENGDVEAEYVEVAAPEITGRVETLAWTQVDFDDSMWDDQMMPVGNEGYMPELQSIWPGGDNTNYWIRRNFELDKVNERLSYELNVCHDDTYETYVNGHLLQKYERWTNGKTPVQVHIPAKYLNVGKNVIATYIQQNWGGKFYDCGINVLEVNYEECVKQFNEAIEYAQSDVLLTNRMKADIKDLIAEAKQFFNENKNDAAEIRNYARELKTAVNVIFGYSNAVKTLKDTWDICRKMEDKGYWGTALEAATAALDTCATASQLTPYLNNLRDARKATAMERHTEKYVGCVPKVVSMDMIGMAQYEDYDEELDKDVTKTNPTYYIYNVGAKNFLGGGESWGTHLAIEYISNPMMLIQAMRDVYDEDGEVIDEEEVEGAYYIETFRPNGAIGSMDFMNWNGFIDCPLNNQGLWQLIPVEGKTNVYNIAQYGTASENEEKTYSGVTYDPGCKRLLGLRNGDNGYAPSYYIVDTDMHDPNLETNQWMFISREELLSFIATASEENPVDLSFLILNPGYDQRLALTTGDAAYLESDGYWDFNNGSIFGRGGDHANFVFEAYNVDEFEIFHEMKPKEGKIALPAGTYVLEVQGYYRDGDEGTHVAKVLANQPVAQRAVFYAGITEPATEGSLPKINMIETMALMPIHIEANKVPGIGYGADQGLRMPGTYGGQPLNATDQAGMEFFPLGLYKNKLAFTLPEGSDRLTIGINKDYDENKPNGDWCVMDNWRLKYYGNEVIDPDAIRGIESDEINKTATAASQGIYNMLGQRLSKLQKGVNIINGKKIIKK